MNFYKFNFVNCLTVVGTLIFNLAYSQQFANYNEQLKNIAPSSPQAAALLKYGEIPVSHYTGVPEISIPVYTIEDKDIKIPITLTYHGSGIKVDEEATFVGLGWSLNVGGAIIQNVAGRNDFGYGGYYNQPPNAIPKLPISLSDDLYNCQAVAGGIMEPYIFFNSRTIKAPFLGSTTYLINPDGTQCIGYIANGQVTDFDDYEPDMFLVNLPNETYKAFIDKNASFQHNQPVFKTVGQHDIKINCLPNNYGYGSYGNPGYIATNSNGVRFEFTDIELRKSDPGSQELQSQTSYLSKVTGIYGNEVNFTYISTSADYDRYRGTNKLIGIKYTFQRGDTGYLSCFSSYGSTKYVSEINFASGKLVFHYSNREDLKNGKKLDKIELYDNMQNKVREFSFIFDYFISNDAQSVKSSVLNLNNIVSKGPITHRLKLTEYKDSKQLNSHKFTYEENLKLPSKISFSVDFWGFYNGVTNDSTFIPNTDKFIRGKQDLNGAFSRDGFDLKYSGYPTEPNISYINDSGQWKLADRRASNYAKANILKKIVYPTGGYTEFEFESNTFSNYGIGSLINDSSYRTDFINFFIDAPYFNNYNGTKTISVTDNNTSVSLSTTFNFWFQNSLNSNANLSFWVYVKDLSTNLVLHKIYNPNIGSFSQAVVEKLILLNQGSYEIGFAYNNYFSDHLYNVLGAGSNNNSDPIYVRSNIIYSNKSNFVANKLHNFSSGGGLRIKKIKVVADNNIPSTTKEYFYEEENNNIVTSYGKLMELPQIYRQLPGCFTVSCNTLIDPPQVCIVNCPPNNADESGSSTFVNIYEGASNFGTSTLSLGNYVGYSKVIEKINGGSEGITIRTFINDCIDDSYGDWSFGKYQYLDNGNILTEELYDSAAVLKKSIINKYSKVYSATNNYYQIYGIKSTNLRPLLAPHASATSLIFHDGFLTYYPINLQRVRLDSTITKEYFNPSEIKHVVRNYYDVLHRISRVETNDSSNKISSKNYFYTYNFTNDPMMQGLVQLNRIDEPIKITEFNDGVKLREERVLFQEDMLSGKILPKNIYGAKFPNTFNNVGNLDNLERKITYDKYDQKGNILQYTLENGIPVTYIWGYGGLYPIAKIENATFDHVTQMLNIPLNSLYALTAAPANIRQLLPEAMITTYTYKPLVGVTSITDPKGLTTTFEYDSAGRLIQVKDYQGKIVSENDYHYKNN